MTYRKLLATLSSLTNDQLDSDVTICFNDEFYPVATLAINDHDDILTENHPYLQVNS